MPVQCADRILSNIAKGVDKTYTGLKSVLYRFPIYSFILAARTWNTSQAEQAFGQNYANLALLPSCWSLCPYSQDFKKKIIISLILCRSSQKFLQFYLFKIISAHFVGGSDLFIVLLCSSAIFLSYVWQCVYHSILLLLSLI